MVKGDATVYVHFGYIGRDRHLTIQGNWMRGELCDSDKGVRPRVRLRLVGQLHPISVKARVTVRRIEEI